MFFISIKLLHQKLVKVSIVQLNRNMKLNYSKLWLLLFLSVSTITCCKDDNSDYNYVMTNQVFVTRAANSNNFEIAVASLAASRTDNAEVKHYSEHIVSDHKTAGMELQNLAVQKGWAVPIVLQQKEQQILEKLTALNGNAFNREFTNLMVQSHQEAVALFEIGSDPKGVADIDLLNMAMAKLPILKSHLQEAIKLKTHVNP